MLQLMIFAILKDGIYYDHPIARYISGKLSSSPFQFHYPEANIPVDFQRD